MTHQDQVTYTKNKSGVGDWEAALNGRGFMCDDILWNFSFLLCRSPSFVSARHVRHPECSLFECLPPSTIPERWDMVNASDMHSVFENGIASLLSVVDLVKLEAFF